MNIFNPLLLIRNPKGKRDGNGKVIDDIKRRRNSRRTEKMIRSGAIQLGQINYTTGGRLYRIGARGGIDTKGETK